MKLKWIEEEVPSSVKIKQVYGVVFNESGKTLLKVGGKHGMGSYSLAGGKPEVFDEGICSTLRREFIEEVNTTLKSPIIYLGYQLVDKEDGTKPYAQIRMAAMIDEIGERKPDPDCGITYGRVLVDPETAIKLLSWGEIGGKIIRKAKKIAQENFGINFQKIDEKIENV